MKSIASKLLVLVLFGLILISCAKEDDEIYMSETNEILNTNNVSYSEIENEILKLVNDHRKSKGLSILSPLNIVSGVADGHTDYMIQKGEVNHDNFERRAQTLMNNTNAKSVAENVAYGYTTAQGTLNGWLNSDSHRKVIETPSFTHFGISTDSCSNGRNYFTHIFIKK